jgi:MFS family permease
MDISSEMIHSLLPVFLVTTLGASATMVGLVEGLGEGAALLVRSFSGALSDRIGRRKPLAIAGYGLGALSKPLFAMAAGAGLVLSARLVDRIGKGIRGAPRDALVADVTPRDMRGSAYGLRQSLDTIGAFSGPLIATGLMVMTAGAVRTVFWIALAPAAVAVAVLIVGVREPARSIGPSHRAPSGRQLTELGRAFWLVAVVGLLFTLARFSEAFLLLRGIDVGLDIAWIPLLLVVMNVVYSVTSYPVGRLSDRIGRRGLLVAGLAALVCADLIMVAASTGWHVAAGTAVWGLHMGLTQGLLSALVADSAPARFRGTAFGVFGLVSGLGTLTASLLAGLVWDAYGADVTFSVGAGLASAAMVGFAVTVRGAAPGPRAEG